MDDIKRRREILSEPFSDQYFSAQRSGISPQLFNRVSGHIFVVEGPVSDKNNRKLPRFNIGLGLKNNTKNTQIQGKYNGKVSI